MEELRPGQTIDGRFELLQLIGRGGMGAVWKAHQRPLGRVIALKVLRPEYSALPHLRRRFAREARAAASLNHEHIASVFDFGTDPGGHMYLAMEHVDGVQLAQGVTQGVSVLEVIRLTRQLLSALAHAHARGVVHRDLKPENVLLAGGYGPNLLGSPKIVDFGIATIASESLDPRETDQDQVIGTPLYMSPEQASGARVLSPRTDLYNMGYIMYELLAGAHPFEGMDHLKVMAAHVNTSPPPLKPRDGLVVPEALVEVIARAMEKRPVDRWPSAAKMSAALEPLELLAQHELKYQRRPLSDRMSWPEDDASPADPTQGQAQDQAPREQAFTPITAPDLPSATLAAQTSGQAEPSAASSEDLDSRSPHAAPAPRRVSLRALPFVGRVVERQQLVELAEQIAQSGQGRVVLFDGETGVGKTRQVMWLKETLEERGLFRGHIGVFTRGMGRGMRGLQEAIESLFRARGLRRDALPAHLREKRAEFGQAPEEGAEADAALLDFLRPRDDHEEQRLIASSSSQLWAAILQALELSASVQPRLILLDDMQWAGPEVADFLAFLAVELRYRRLPLMLVCVQRTEAMSENEALVDRLLPLSRHAGETVERLTLGRMSDQDASRLLRAVLPCEEELAQVIVSRAAGNPMHLVALARYLSDEDLLEFGQSRWAARDMEEVRRVVPPSLGDVFRERIRQVEARHLSGGRLLKLMVRCAVLGKRFSYEVLHDMIGLEADVELRQHLDEDFDQLLAEGFITEVVGRGEEWYTFHHGLLRDVLLRDCVGPAQTRRLHRMAAQAIEIVHALDAQHHAAEIAQHWHAAREPELAMDWYWQAAQTARRSYQARQALMAYEQVMAMMVARLDGKVSLDRPQWVLEAEHFERARVSRSRYLRALVYIGDLREGLGEFDQAEAIYRQVVRMCGRPLAQMDIDVLVPLCQAWLGLGHIAWQRGDFTAAYWAFERVFKVLQEADKAPDIAVSAQRGMARVAWHRGEYDQARAMAQQGYERAVAIRDDESRAECLWIMGEVARMIGEDEEANAQFKRSLAIYEQAMIPTGIARNLLSMAQVARHHKDFARASALYQRALKHYEALGDRRGAGLCYNGLGESARFEARYEDARQMYTRALEIMESIGAQYDVAIAYANLGLIEMRRRELFSAEHYLRQARKLIADKDFPYVLAGIEYNLALVKAMRGEEEEATSILRTVIDLNDRVPVLDVDFAEPLEQLGSLRAERGSTEEAVDLWERASEIYRELRLDKDLERVQRRLRALRGSAEERDEPGPR